MRSFPGPTPLLHFASLLDSTCRTIVLLHNRTGYCCIRHCFCCTTTAIWSNLGEEGIADVKKGCGFIPLFRNGRKRDTSMSFTGSFPDKFTQFCRLSIEAFDRLLILLGPHLSYEDTVMRRAISAEERLLITLR
ncbi:uncharacterized protein LOC143788828 [Ranitomeya variabilis]|uniref:uncharacterized protein LOC143788828 n=1 Tax=Ranitomeya variabilis TaxID=490064 RepID=UPI0040573C85